MRCLRQPLASLFLFAAFCGLAWSQPSFTSLRSPISHLSAALTPGGTVASVNSTANITSIQAASDQLGNEHDLRGLYE
jgi:hypothetical protein